MPGAGPTREPSAHARVIAAWLAVAAWAALIWWLGSGAFGASTTSRYLEPLLTWLWPDSSHAQRLAVLLTLRKLAHPTVYAVLAVLTCRAARVSGARTLQAVAVAFGLAVGLAALDETRQMSLATRTGSPYDVGLDASGAAAALLAYARWRRPLPALETGRRE